MRLILLALVLMLAGPAWGAEQVMRSGQNELRLFDSACSHAGTLAQLDQHWRPRFRKAMARVNGQTVYACWINHENTGHIYVLFENGEQGMWDARAFKDTSV